MADDTPKKADIQSMLNNLAQKQQGGSGSASPPQAEAPQDVPPNLPTDTPGTPQAPQSPPKPAPPPAPKPPAPPAGGPATTAPPQPTSPVPAPKVPAPPKPVPPAAAVPQTPPPPAGGPAPQAKEQPPVPAPSGIAGQPQPKKEEAPAAEMTTEVRTMPADISRLSTGQAPAPITPQIPSEKPEKAAPPAPPTPAGGPPKPAPPPGEITIPETPSGGMGRKTIIIVVGVVILLLLGYVVISFLGGEEPAPTPTPTPQQTLRPTPTPTPAGKDLSSYFGQLSGTLTVPDTPPPREDFQNQLRELMPSAGAARNIEVSGGSGFPATLRDVPADTFGIGAAVLIFAQTEHFDSSGQRLDGASPEPRLIYIIELADASAANKLIQEWEAGTMAEELSYFYASNVSDALVMTFSDATYRQVPVRYQNFPYADLSADWAIVPASNNKNYLVISGSRESMFFAIDQLLK